MARHPALPATLALACALATIAIILPAPARAADGLIVTSDAVYRVLPDEGRVTVTIDAVATNVTPDSATHEFYFTGLTMAIQAGAEEIAATSGGVGLPVTVVDATDDYTAIEVPFGNELLYEQSHRMRVTYVLEDAGGAPGRDTVIRQSFVAFPIWAFATPDATNASIEVAWPKGYDVSLQVGEMRQTPTATGPLLSARDIADPADFFAYVTGEADGARTAEKVSVEMEGGEVELLMLAWIDDPDWLQRQTAVLSVGLPALERAIGVEYPVSGTLSVSEHAYRHLGDYAGTFNPTVATIKMRFDADAFVALHEASHAWFNGTLFEDRWILEGFASYYAEQVGTELELEMLIPELTPEMEQAAFQLNDWLGLALDDPAREDYAYAATPLVAAEIAALAGADGLQAVWRAAAADRLAYAASDDDARSTSDPQAESWQRLLDLLENETAADYDPILVEWVLNDAQAQLLDEREAARVDYEASVSAADGWTLPRSTRVLLDAWDFEAAQRELTAATQIFAQRASLEEQAEALGLEPTAQLRAAFEDDGLDAARREADEQVEALRAIDEATESLDAEPSIAEQVGLIGEVPPSEALAAAREAFEAGDDDVATNAAGDAIAQRADADSRGRTRVAVVGGGILGLDLLAMGLLALRRRRRQTAPRAA